MTRQKLLLVMLILSSATAVFARGTAARDSSVLVIDDIRFEAERFVVDSATNVATVELSLVNLKKTPRELKVNVYGTQLVDDRRDAYYFSTIGLGRVLMRFTDKQNYLHYLLQPDSPAKLVITAESISPGAAIQVVKIVFEDSAEEGRFLDAYLTEASGAAN